MQQPSHAIQTKIIQGGEEWFVFVRPDHRLMRYNILTPQQTCTRPLQAKTADKIICFLSFMASLKNLTVLS